MNQKLLLYVLSGLVSGVLATIAVLLATIKAAPQALAPFVPRSDRLMLAGSLVADRDDDDGMPGGRGWMMGKPDRHFIVMMMPHHEDAIAMADLALTKAKRPEIKTLAQTIKTTQTRENQQMASWYQAWYGAPVPAWQTGSGMMGGGWRGGTAPRAGGGMGPGMMERRFDRDQVDFSGFGPMGNCMGRTDLEALRNAADFDRAFIEQMIPHHEMGVMMAQMVRNRSQHSEIQTLAEAIIKGQTAEIQQMQRWYQTWYGTAQTR